jgi:hypothetical protein
MEVEEREERKLQPLVSGRDSRSPKARCGIQAPCTPAFDPVGSANDRPAMITVMRWRRIEERSADPPFATTQVMERMQNMANGGGKEGKSSGVTSEADFEPEETPASDADGTAPAEAPVFLEDAAPKSLFGGPGWGALDNLILIDASSESGL